MAVYLSCLSGLTYLTLLLLSSPTTSLPVLMAPSWIRNDYEMVALEDIPSFATPIVVSDEHGLTKWTVSIPPDAHSPSHIQHTSPCEKHAHKFPYAPGIFTPQGPPPTKPFSTCPEKTPTSSTLPPPERAGLLPPHPEATGAPKGHLVGINEAEMAHLPVCERSLTVTLESNNAGLGHSLMTLWTFYGLAQQQNRAFFIDDSRWAYGSYSEIFDAPPVPQCRPPPRHHMVPCPLQARHLVISSANAHDHLLGLLAQSPMTQKNPLYSLARTGHQALFHPNAQDTAYIASRTAHLRQSASAKNGPFAPVIAMHIRHGDRHPLESQYHQSYIPLTSFLDASTTLAQVHHNTTTTNLPLSQAADPFVVIATDDPVVFETEEFSTASRAQDHIRLASKAAIQRVEKNRLALHRFVDETIGWEGGFYSPMFWSLGQPAGKAINLASKDPTTLTPSADTLKLRNYLGRAYVMDLAVLVESGDYVMCTVSAMGCRLLAVMMGWERAFENGRWVNVDGEFGWTGLNWDLDL